MNFLLKSEKHCENISDAFSKLYSLDIENEVKVFTKDGVTLHGKDLFRFSSPLLNRILNNVPSCTSSVIILPDATKTSFDRFIEIVRNGFTYIHHKEVNNVTEIAKMLQIDLTGLIKKEPVDISSVNPLIKMENLEYFEYDVSTNVGEKSVNIKEEIKTEFPENFDSKENDNTLKTSAKLSNQKPGKEVQNPKKKISRWDFPSAKTNDVESLDITKEIILPNRVKTKKSPNYKRIENTKQEDKNVRDTANANVVAFRERDGHTKHSNNLMQLGGNKERLTLDKKGLPQNAPNPVHSEEIIPGTRPDSPEMESSSPKTGSCPLCERKMSIPLLMKHCETCEGTGAKLEKYWGRKTY